MGADLMGRVVVEATVESLADLYFLKKGIISPNEVKRVTIPDALVDTGATTLSMPKRYLDALGLKFAYERPSRSSKGAGISNVYEAVKLWVQGRFCTVDVVELPDDVPVLIGQVPLELMDWVVDPRGQRLIGNPDHGGEQTIELY